MSDAQPAAQPPSAKLILLTSLLTGTLDIAAAVINHYAVGGRHPERIFRFIASGVFGPPALLGGAGYAALGLAFHYVIAFCFTGTFLVAYRHVRLDRSPWWLNGTVYGAAIWAIMNLLVVPNSNISQWSFTPGGALLAAAILMVCIGIPTAYFAERFLSSRRKQPAV